MSITFTDLLLYDVNAERSDAMIIELAADAAVRIPQSLSVIAHVVLDGEVTIDVDSMDEPVTMRTGECGILLYGTEHRLHGKIPQRRNDHVIDEWPAGDEPPRLRVGDGATGARMLSAALRISHVMASVRRQHPLSELLHLKHGVQPFFVDKALMTDAAQIDTCCQGRGANAFINAMLNLQLTHALRCAVVKLQEQLPLLPNVFEAYRNPAIRPVTVAVRLLRMHPERQWTVAELARELGLSRSSFAAKFRTCVGVGPMQYLNDLRMKKAAELLRSRRDFPLCAIGRQVGYDNSSSFARAFKAHFALSPRAFLEKSFREDAAKPDSSETARAACLPAEKSCPGHASFPASAISLAENNPIRLGLRA